MLASTYQNFHTLFVEMEMGATFFEVQFVNINQLTYYL